MKSLVHLICVLLLAPIVLAQTEEGTGIVYGRDHSFLVSAPEGWVLDNAAGRAAGLQAVFYPVGQSWADAQAVMYANTSVRDADSSETLAELIAYDVGRFKESSPNLDVSELASIVTADGKHASVRKFTGDQHHNVEAVAYIEEETVFVMLVLSARTEESYEKTFSAFQTLVEKYKFLTRDVSLPE